jgi:uncharacterized protein (TIGR03086 family)
MAQQKMPNPIEVYEGAVQLMLPTIIGVKANQLMSSTPCAIWNVRALLNHNIRVQGWTNSVLTGVGGDPSGMFAVDEPLPREGAEAALRANTKAVLATLKSMDLQKVVETPFGPMPAGNFIMFPMLDLVVHKWDLAKATNQSTSLDSGLAGVCFQVLSGALSKGRDPNFFGAEVAVPANASIQNKLLGLSGRQP